MFYIAKTIFPFLLGIFSYFYIANNYSKFDKLYFSSYKLLLIVTILFLSLEYWILGPYSLSIMHDEADHGLSRIVHDLDFIGGKFLHNILGGSDFYASQLHGGQYISFEKILFKLFPTWIGLFIHKFLIILLNFIGIILILKKYSNSDNFNIYALSLFAAVFNPYSISNTLQHGLGYGLIALSIYFFVFRINSKNYFLYNFLFSILVSISISVTHSFLPIFYGTLIFGIFYCSKNYLKFFLSILILLILVLINWSEVIYGILNFIELTDRGKYAEQIPLMFFGLLGILPHLFYKTNLCFINCNFQYSPFVLLILVALYFIIKNFNKENSKLLLIILLTIYLPIIFKFINYFGMDFLKSININNIGLFLIIPVTMVLSKLNFKKLHKNFFSIIIALAVIINFHNKIEASKQILFNGGQNRIFDVENLKKENWKDKKRARVVTTMPYQYFHPNFLWVYGHETLDGYINLIPSSYIDYWRYGVFKGNHKENEYYRNGDLYINYTHKKNPFSVDQISFEKSQRDLKEKIDINILKLINTGYVVSYIELSENGIKKISGPEKEYFSITSETGTRNKNYYITSSAELLKNLFKTPEVFIYELTNFTDKFYFPEKILKIDSSLKIDETMRYMSDNYKKNIAFVDQNLINLQSAKGNIKEIKEIKNGYKINVQINQKGLAVFNQIHLPFWNLYVNGEKRQILKVNHNLMGMILNKNDNLIEFKYERELLRERLKINFL